MPSCGEEIRGQGGPEFEGWRLRSIFKDQSVVPLNYSPSPFRTTCTEADLWRCNLQRSEDWYVIVRIIVVHLFTGVVNKWDYYSLWIMSVIKVLKIRIRVLWCWKEVFSLQLKNAWKWEHEKQHKRGKFLDKCFKMKLFKLSLCL